MNEKLQAYVEELFKYAPKTKQAVEIKEEILRNSIDRYNDLIKEGRTPEAAYNISVAGIGDVSHLIDSMIAPVSSSGYTKEEIAANEKKRTLLLAVSVAMYILSVIPPIICDELGAPEFVGATLLFVIVALATALIIYRNGIKLKYDKSDGTVAEDFKEWNRVYNFYIPTLYINGRGNRYEESKAAGFAYTGTPKFLESQNMLTDRFKAYYTSDGYSSCFRLPFTDLDKDTVQCRVYKNSTEYTDWLIMEGQSSVTAIFDNLEITLSVDRKKGMLNFTNYAGDYSVPVMSRYHENNICVTAAKTVKNGIENAVSSTCCAVNGSRIVFSGGKDKGRVISVRAENPLYFPCDSSYKIVGEDGVYALLNTKNGILAFRKNEIYALTLKNGTAINSNSLLADDDSVFYNSDSFTAKRISDNKGLLNKYACIPCGNYILWLGSDRAVYAVNISSYEITKLSEAVDGFFDNLSESEVENIFAVQNGNRYLLLIGRKAVIMDYGNGGLSEPAWYFWSFPNTKVLGGFSSSGELCVFCTGTDGRVFYTAKLSGAEDTDISINNNAPEIKKQFVPSKAETKSFDFGNISLKKLIDSISLSVAANSKLEIFINGRRFDSLNLGEPDIDYTCGTLKSVRLLPHLSPVKSLQLKLCSNSAFSLGELIINYRETV